jgi:5,6-dimethylbenzimidazole synthase
MVKGFYETLFNRRDVRGEFRGDAIPDDVLARLLIAAHHAPSVGLSQPWNFIVVQSAETKARVHREFCEANEEAVKLFEGERQQQYHQLKLQGILEAPVNLCVTCDRTRGGETVLGRTHQRDMDLYSTVCAVQNLWLAARAEGLGMGWVSIIKPEALNNIFQLPESVVPISYLCLGYVDFFRERPELEEKGWEKRAALKDLVFSERWGQSPSDSKLFDALDSQQDWPLNFILPSQAKDESGG